MPTPPTLPTGELAWDYADWRETLAATVPSGADLFSETNQSAGLTVEISPKQRRDFLLKVLGYAYADAATPWRLRRINPINHPFWGFLNASRVGFTQYQPAGNPDDAETKARVTVAGAPFAVNKFGYYAGCRAQVEFGPLTYPVRGDSLFGGVYYVKEYDRHVDFYANLGGEISIISAETGAALLWAETSAGGPTVGRPFSGEIGEYIVKSSQSWVWHDVPIEYLFDATTNLPKKLLAGLGKVNLNAFRGNPAGTLLLNGFGLSRFSYPFRNVLYDPAFGFDVTFQVSQFDPTPGAAAPLFRGHNLMPYSAKAGAGGSIWYAALRPGTGNRYLESYDFDKFFEHVGAP